MAGAILKHHSAGALHNDCLAWELFYDEHALEIGYYCSPFVNPSLNRKLTVWDYRKRFNNSLTSYLKFERRNGSKY